ncbi:MAG: FAD-dependent monooxygenase [Alphaproteobacteria bacterium]|nr:FAD-dependent monooxygenase [Alphaproteobacteria bacterium]
MRIIVAGSGPAGIVTAGELARLGHQVTILAAPRSSDGLEGFSFRVVEGLRAAGLGEALAELEAPVPRHSAWNGHAQSAGSEQLIERTSFDAALLAAASRFADLRPARLAAAARRGETIAARIVTAEGATTTLNADFLIDARGRGAPGGGRKQSGPATVALCRRYDIGNALLPSTWLETSPRGWAWLAVPGSCTGYLQVTVAGKPDALSGRRQLDSVFEALAAEFPGIAAHLAKATPKAPVFARLSTASACEEAARERVLRVGDAALALDPLSGHGVFEAIAGAFAAAATVNTMLCRPRDRALALRFYNERVRSTFAARVTSGRAYYQQEERWPGAPFWSARRNWPPEEAADVSSPAIQRRPVIDHGFIAEAEVIVTPEEPRGVWLRDGVPVVALWRLLESGAIDGPETAAQALGVPVPAAARALAWLATIKLRG